MTEIVTMAEWKVVYVYEDGAREELRVIADKVVSALDAAGRRRKHEGSSVKDFSCERIWTAGELAATKVAERPTGLASKSGGKPETGAPTPADGEKAGGGDEMVVFVFGSNLAGRHGKGAAKEAMLNWGAVYGVGVGPTGRAYAIPTKDHRLQVLPLREIGGYVAAFLAWADVHPEVTFRLTAIGCGLAGYKPTDIAPLFRDAPPNVIKPPEFL